ECSHRWLPLRSISASGEQEPSQRPRRDLRAPGARSRRGATPRGTGSGKDYRVDRSTPVDWAATRSRAPRRSGSGWTGLPRTRRGRRSPPSGRGSDSGRRRRAPGPAALLDAAALGLLVGLEAVGHEGLALVALQRLGGGVGVALLHLVLLAHRRGGRRRLQALGHEGLALVALLVAGLGVARLHLLLLRGELLLVGGEAGRAEAEQ